MRFALLQSLRDVRSSWGKLVIYGSAIACGVAIIAFTNLLTASIRSTLDTQSRSLLGGDIELQSKSPVPVPSFNSDGATSAEEVSFRSMASFSRTGSRYGSRLVVVRALEPALPLYGEMVTQPDGAWNEVVREEKAGVLVDEALLVQMAGAIGDVVEVAGGSFVIKGTVSRSTGQTGVASVFAPRVYIARRHLPDHFLKQKGAVADYTRLIRLSEGENATEYVKLLRQEPHFKDLHIRTIADSRARLERISRNIATFLYLVAFTALVLGVSAVAASFSGYIKSKRQTIGVLKCLGASSRDVQQMFLAQALAVGLLTSLIGTGLGVGLFLILPNLIARVVPLPIDGGIRWESLLPAVIAGSGSLLLAALPSLQLAGRVSPLVVLRIDDHSESIPFWLYGVATIAFFGFSVSLAPHVQFGLALAGSTLVAGVLLAAVASTLRAFARRATQWTNSIAYRQGAAALYRPNNQTLLLFVIFGLTSALTSLGFIARHLLLTHSQALDADQKANVYVFDIAPEQKSDIISLFESLGLKVLQDSPIVLTRIASVKGVPSSTLLTTPGSRVPPWALRREFWSTYRDTVTTNEAVIAGNWTPRVQSSNGPIPISIEDGLADHLGVGLGDEITFHIQGVDLKTTVGSIRDIQWEKLERNSLIVFPVGVLEDAPQFRFLSTHSGDIPTTATLQRQIVQRFPNVSVIDISDIVAGVKEILTGIEQAASVLGLLLLLIALTVLVSTILSSYRARIREVALLRTLGASSSTIRRSIQAEYLLLFVVGGIAGLVVSLVGGYALATFVFETVASFPWIILTSLFAFLVMGALITASLVTAPVLRHPSLESIRNE